ncbi:MAG: sugar phosphate isomerase/epimerase [Clostridia bacterium]|nr:sugar phosphate isomerase/epimerase [Clostridia bacterium]
MKKSIIYDHLLTAAEQEGVSIAKILSFAASLGYVGTDVRWRSADALCETQEMLKKEGFSLSSVYRFWDLTFPVDHEDANAFFACLGACGCDHAMIIPRGDGAIKDKNAAFETVCARLNEICDIAKNQKITVTVEDFDAVDAIICNTETLERAFVAVPKLRHTFDTGNYTYFYESPIAAFELFKDKIVHVHLKDRALAPVSSTQKAGALCDGKAAYSCAVGDGFVEIEQCIRSLHKNGYNGYLSVEHYGLDQMKTAIQRSAAYIDRILADVEK